MQGNIWGKRTLALLAATVFATSFEPLFWDVTASAQTEALHHFSIPPTTIRQAMNEVARVTGVDVVFPETPLASRRNNAVSGDLSTSQAVANLLAGSGLSFRFTNSNTVTIYDGSNAENSGSSDGSTLLAPITIVGRRSRTEGTGEYTIESMTTATGLGLAPIDTPQSVSVVTNQQIKDQGTTSVQGALKKTTGVNVLRDSGQYRFQSRGFFMDQIKEDGISSFVGGSYNNPFRAASALSDLEVYDHIEVQRGPAGLMQGSGAPGGTVNLVRKRPTEDFQASTTTSVGSWDKYRQTVDVSGGLNEQKTVRARFIGVGEKADSFKDYNETKNGTLYGIVEADLGEATTLTVGGLYQKSRETPDFFGLPTASDGSPLGLDTSTYLGASWNELNREKKNVFVDLSHELTDDWKIDINANYTNYHMLTQYASLVGNGGNTAFVNGMTQYDNEADQLGITAKLSGTYELFGREHEAFAAINYNRAEFTAENRYLLNSTVYDVFTFDGAQITKPDWSGNLRTHAIYGYTVAETGYNFGTRYNLTDSLHAVVGGRFTQYDIETEDTYITEAGRPSGRVVAAARDRNKFIPYFGATYDVTSDISVYASYTNIFNPQSYQTVSGGYLPPVEGQNFEVGVKTSLFDDRVSASFALFDIRQKNRPISVPGTIYFVSEGEVQSRGFEVELSGEIRDGWNLFAGYTFNRSKYLKTESTSYVEGAAFNAYTPTHLFRLHTTYQLPVDDGKWTIGAGLQTQSETTSTYGISQGGYTVVDASLKYDFNDTTTFQFAANNIFDKRYFENHQTRSIGVNNFYGDPRNFTFSVSKKF